MSKINNSVPSSYFFVLALVMCRLLDVLISLLFDA